MSDVATKAHASATGINNGSTVVHTFNTGVYSSMTPGSSGVTGVNYFLTSGEMFTKWDDRMDSYYYYSTSGAP